MKTSKDTAARNLAAAHYAIEPGIERIVRLVAPSPEQEDDPEEPIKLLEVNADTIAAGVMPLFFGPDAGEEVPYSSVIVELTPEEYQEVCADPTRLPNGWRMGPELSRAA